MAKRDTESGADTMKVGLNDLADTLNEVVDDGLRTSESPPISESHKHYVREYELENELGSLFLTQKEIGDVNCVVWDAALVLAKYLEKRSMGDEEFLKGKRIIELGAGLGCVGLVAAFYGGNVTLTDLPGAYLQQLNYNVQSNKKIISKKGSANAVALDWNDKNMDIGDFDVMLAADCVYYEESVPGLVSTMLKISTPKTEIYLSQENRSYSEIQNKIWGDFCDEISKKFKMEMIPQLEQHEEYRSPDIILMRLTKL